MLARRVHFSRRRLGALDPVRRGSRHRNNPMDQTGQVAATGLPRPRSLREQYPHHRPSDDVPRLRRRRSVQLPFPGAQHDASTSKQFISSTKPGVRRCVYYNVTTGGVDGKSILFDQVDFGSFERGSPNGHEAWLQGLGLERYVPAFRDNEIDWEVLPKLTSDDLREIDVAAIGHRRKLLEAIYSRSAPHGADGALRGTGSCRCRAAAADGDVLRPGRFDGIVGAARSRRTSRGDRRLSPLHRGSGAPLRRLRRQIHGRRRAGLFRLSAGPRRRCRARGARRPRGGRGDARRRRRRSAGGAHRHRHRARRRRRPDWRRRLAGAGGGRRDAEPGGAIAGFGRARRRGDRRRHAPAHRQPVPAASHSAGTRSRVSPSRSRPGRSRPRRRPRAASKRCAAAG